MPASWAIVTTRGAGARVDLSCAMSGAELPERTVAALTSHNTYRISACSALRAHVQEADRDRRCYSDRLWRAHDEESASTRVVGLRARRVGDSVSSAGRRSAGSASAHAAEPV